MIVPVFAVYDSKSCTFGNPFTQVNVATAIRAFAQAVNTPGSFLFSNPEDFSLMHIATWDDDIGIYCSINHENLGLGSSFKKE